MTAKLSRKFYERFGDEIANELVEWFNHMDATYRLELRDLADGYFARFDAKLEQRTAELRQDISRLEGRLEAGLASLRAELVKWMFLFWVGTALTVIGIVKL